MRYKVITVYLTFLLLLPIVTGCSMLNMLGDSPSSVTVTSFKVIASSNLAPNFKIDLHVFNPNSSALKLDGLYYSIEIDGHTIVEGVSNDMPTIGAYDAGDIELTATANVFNSLRLISDLTRNAKEYCSYKLTVKLSLGMLRPSIRVAKEGTLSLRDLTR
ncbi:MAG: hypothetical protein B6I36_02790 [Desulfobacteraceae bacterium 4572_35.1]|nr:MAG: hypothetical protein B6I36_02790 [Desulfobacteraceae bacterium 4572_35.1]